MVVYEKIKTIDNFELDVEIREPECYKNKIVIMCHGLTSSKHGRHNQLLKIAETLYKDGYKVIQFDWRGHGKSSGRDLDVTLSSFQTDLSAVIDKYIKDEELYLFGFSFGGLAVNQYLYLKENISIKKVVLIGPPLDPINSSLLNANTFCQPEILNAQINGSLEINGFVELQAKKWKMSKLFIKDCYDYDYKSAIKYLSNRTLLLQGNLDRNVDKLYNKNFAKQYCFQYKEFQASHSLKEVIDQVSEDIKNFYNKP